MTSPSPALLFQRLRWQLLRNSLRVVFQRSLARVVTIFLCSLVVWGMLFYVSWRGFGELKSRWDFPLDGRLMGLLFDLMFFSLAALLIFSTGIILHSSLFSAPESMFLLGCPVPDDRIFAYKYQGAVAFSSWGFLLLGSPILIAYGLVVNGGAPWYFFAVLPLFFLGFVLMPGSIGALFTLALVNFVPRKRWHLLWIFLIALHAFLAWLGYRIVRPAGAMAPQAIFANLLGLLSDIAALAVPCHWVTAGFKAAALGEIDTMLYYLALLWSNGLMLYLGTVWIARRLFRRGFNLRATGGDIRRRYGGGPLDECLERLVFFLDPQTRLLIIKDFRTFRRDPAQWLQILIFLGLAVLYFSNMRRYYEQEIGRPFQNFISLLTLTATSFLMCAYTGRFIFPMLSLEGRKFWILGLLPMKRDRLLWGKFAFSSAGCLILAEFLIIFSDLMLNMPGKIIGIHALTIAVLALGLSGLSVGLGACMPNFRETDPSKIAVGFGGTLNLVAGLFLLIVVIGLMAAPFHLILAARGQLADMPWWPWLLTLAGAGVGALAIYFPLKAGARNLRAMEF